MHLINTYHMVHNESFMLDIATYYFYRNIMILLKTYKN